VVKQNNCAIFKRNCLNGFVFFLPEGDFCFWQSNKLSVLSFYGKKKGPKKTPQGAAAP